MVRKRLKHVLCLCAALLLGGCAYAMLCKRLGFGIPCLFHLLTGLQCPGCGVSRMALCLLNLDFAGAWGYNPAVLCLLPFGLAVGADWAVRYIHTGSKRLDPWAEWLTWGMAGALLLFGIGRNLPLGQ